MNTEDVVFSHLRTRYPELLAAALVGIDARRARVLPVALPTVRKVESDFAVTIVRPKPSYVLHAEHWSARGSLALTALYHMWYHEATGLPVRTIIVTTTPRLARAVPREYSFRVTPRPATRIPLEALHLWRLSARRVLDDRQVVLYPFVPVMKDPRPGRLLLAELRERIIADSGAEKDGANLLAAAYFIATRRFGEGLLETVLGGVGEMAKTDLGQKLIEEGKAIGVEEGKAIGVEEGKAIGEVRAKRQTLLRLLRAKFGAVPEDAVRRVEALDDVAQLDALLDRILTAGSIMEMGLA